MNNELKKYQMFDLVNELKEASEAYYNSGNPIMSDFEFDYKLEKLKNLECQTGISLTDSPTQYVGASILKNIQDVVHKTPMLSLDKCHSADEIRKFANGKDLVASVKLDGLTVRLNYHDGNLVGAESRGNGIKGNDLFEYVKQFIGVPLHINKSGTYVIDGEALIKLDDFESINISGEYKNSRNLAAGTLSSLDTSVVKKRKLTWYAWEIVEGDNLSNSFYERLHEAQDLGFRVVPNCLVVDDRFDEIDSIIKQTLEVASDKFLPQDGVVFKFEDVRYGKSLGNTSHHFRNGVAWKAANNFVETELLNIEWTMGKAGTLCPTAVFKPVKIYDTIVERASLSNLSIMKNTLGDPYVGQKIMVSKRNMIIPKVESGVKKYVN